MHTCRVVGGRRRGTLLTWETFLKKPDRAGARGKGPGVGGWPRVLSAIRAELGGERPGLNTCRRPHRARRRAGDSSAGMSPSSPDRLHLQHVEGHGQVGKQPTKYPVLTKGGKSRGRNEEGGSVGSPAARQQSGYSQSRKLSPVVLARYTYLFRVCTCMCLEKVSTSSFLLTQASTLVYRN